MDTQIIVKACLGLHDIKEYVAPNAEQFTAQDDLYKSRVIQKEHDDLYNKVHGREGTRKAKLEWMGWKNGKELEGGSL